MSKSLTEITGSRAFTETIGWQTPEQETKNDFVLEVRDLYLCDIFEISQIREILSTSWTMDGHKLAEQVIDAAIALLREVGLLPHRPVCYAAELSGHNPDIPRYQMIGILCQYQNETVSSTSLASYLTGLCRSDSVDIPTTTMTSIPAPIPTTVPGLFGTVPANHPPPSTTDKQRWLRDFSPPPKGGSWRKQDLKNAFQLSEEEYQEMRDYFVNFCRANGNIHYRKDDETAWDTGIEGLKTATPYMAACWALDDGVGRVAARIHRLAVLKRMAQEMIRVAREKKRAGK